MFTLNIKCGGLDSGLCLEQGCTVERIVKQGYMDRKLKPLPKEGAGDKPCSYTEAIIPLAVKSAFPAATERGAANLPPNA